MDSCREGKTLDAMRKTNMMQQRRKLMNELGFLPSANVLYLYVRTNGPLERQDPKYISGLLNFSSADGKEGSMYQGKRYVQKKYEKISITKHSVPLLRLGGLRHTKKEKNHKV
jgi:hypothetical protein